MVNHMNILNASSRFSSSRDPKIQSTLPQPTPDEQLKSQQLQSIIFEAIQTQQGSISFAQYMELVLYTPTLGYYSGNLQKFGKNGDFITAPEISPLFSRCLAKQCQEVLKTLSQGSVLEIGAGSGQMAVDILLELEKLNCLPDQYFIIEISPALQKIQQLKIEALGKEFSDRVQWLNAVPDNFSGIILANELLDALPVHRFCIQNASLFENVVTCVNDTLVFKNILNEHPLINAMYQSEFFNDVRETSFYCSEINLELKTWMNNLVKNFTAGVILFIDYGFPRHEYYHPHRNQGTLMCHYRHYALTDPYFYPGLQDITAHVDFTHVAECALEAGLEVVGFTNQASFLIGCGLIELAQQPLPHESLTLLKDKGHTNALTHQRSDKNQDMSTAEIKKYTQSQAINLLTSPAEMGELFKVMALSKGFDAPLSGFRLNDWIYRL